MSDAEETWRHVPADQLQRHLPDDAQYYSLPRQTSHQVCAVTADQRKASTLPRRFERSRSDGMKSAKTETETGSDADGKCRKGKLGKSSVGDLQLLETVAKISTAFETETALRDVTDDVTRDTRTASKNEDVCEPVRGSVVPVLRRGRRSRPSVVAAGRRSSAVAVARRGKSTAARRAPFSGRVPPVGASATTVTADGPASAACWVTCLDSRDSDEDSYVTACNSTPLLSRSFPSTRKDRGTQHGDNRKSVQTGTSRRRRRRLKSPSTYDPVGGEPTTSDHPVRQTVYQETTVMFVPIPVTIILLFLYVVGGAVMFHQLYDVEDWPLAAYITLAAMLTVGGWYPDRRTDDDDGEAAAAARWISWPPDARFVYAAWVVVGLVMVSACLRLTVQTLSHCVCSCRKSAARCQP